eukprot:TRINITY_DN44986_c0_g1_i1.p1 TRINITY_DN44986_c0_g1~~TRINITY_DN44986_c0_g1_i1.p1  ORF type:complete len:236 (+),score=120.04 TRINITY_DN44986_c0_g1_i1:54-710(+)
MEEGTPPSCADAVPGPSPRPGRSPLQRGVFLAAVLAGIVLLGHVSGAAARFNRAALREMLAKAGPLGPVLLAAAFSVGELLHVPGVVFIAVGAAAFPTPLACAANYFAALCSVSTTFFVVRGAGGQLLGAVHSPLMQRALARLADSPVSTVAVLRTFLFVAPALNYALALSTVSYPHYLVGSAAGLLLPVTLLTVFADSLIGAVSSPAAAAPAAAPAA